MQHAERLDCIYVHVTTDCLPVQLPLQQLRLYSRDRNDNEDDIDD